MLASCGQASLSLGPLAACALACWAVQSAGGASLKLRGPPWLCQAPCSGCPPTLPVPSPWPCPPSPQWVTCPQGSDLSLEDCSGQTPLHAAARGGHVEVLAMLLQRGVNVNARDQDGLTPLLLAVRGRYSGGPAPGGCVGRGATGGGPG